MDAITREQYRRNSQSRNGWNAYATHRSEVARLLLDQATLLPTDEICLLGAGNCNDLDLASITASVGRVHLVDCDVDSLSAGVAAQGFANDNRIELHAGVDLTGFFARLVTLTPRSSASDVLALADEMTQTCAFDLPRPARVVASIGLLSQLIEAVVSCIGERHESLEPLVRAIRIQHLRLLARLCVAGGRLLLVSEIVSSDTLPELLSVNPSGLLDVLHQAVARGNFFTGLNPRAILNDFQTDPILMATVDSLRVTPPWCWQFISRTYACVGFMASRRRMGGEATRV